ncbi:hypothetical protein GCM10011386_12670 [Parapedobacter defluvii]|uniref:Uncharacterized protein n=1 Tax=Parapedobacter defluvii TaxID=2045106 RepID=A0ABQ1LH57_9SPHI|nr:hypothetical protein [Parapedobacter defluvii]GGC22208.1 hypothetical protein GCM10011386_12670 [Parapedobacter defluvii]
MKVRKYLLRFVLIYFIIGLLSNLPILNAYILYKIDNDHFKYSNADASFTVHETFGFKNPRLSQQSIKFFIEEMKPTPENQKVYRLYRINPLCFWRWSYYLFQSVDFEYKSWKEIEPNRVPYDPENRWQHF